MQNDAKKLEKWLKPWHMGLHLRVLSESIRMNTIMQGLDGFQKSLRHCALDDVALALEGLRSMHFVGNFKKYCFRREAL